MGRSLGPLACSPRLRHTGRWAGTRGTQTAPEEGEHGLFGFLTTEPNGVVRPVHSKAMPVILTTQEEMDAWMTVPMKEALALQRPLPEEMLEVVAVGKQGKPGG